MCKKCEENTVHRFVKDSRGGRSGYYICVICSEVRSVNHRKKHWYRYLAQKANARKRVGSDKMTERILVDLRDKQKNMCALTNIPFDIESKWFKPSLDRKDSSKGYTVDNIQLTLWIVNHCKGDVNDAEFIQMCNLVATGVGGVGYLPPYFWKCY